MFRAFDHYARRAFYALLSGPRAVLWLLLAPFRGIGRLFVQIANWWSRRETRYLLRGLPALVVFVGAAFLLFACRMQSEAVLAEQYLSAARVAEATQPAEAALLLERVVQLRPKDNETLFELASMTQRAGDQARTVVLMRELAPDPETGPGYWPAHMEMGKSYLKIQHLSSANFQKAKKHFDQVLELNHDNPEAYAYLGHLYYGRGMWDEAIVNFNLALKHGKNEDGEVRADLQVVMLLLAKAYSFRKNLDEAEKLAHTARDVYAARVAQQPEKDAESRIILADACMFLEDFEGASKVLNEGLLLVEDEKARISLRGALARFNVAWADALLQQADSPEQTRVRRFELLSAALLLDPHFVLIFDRMMKILAEQNETADAARGFLLENVTAGRSIGLSHLLLGSAAFAAEETTTAEYHLTRAYDALPNALIVTNNLAWFLAFKDPPELERALELINNVLKRSPNDPRYLDTRGQIYTKFERWDEAIADLERALQQGLPGAETHEALAVCYGAKGLPELEHLHRQSAAAERAK
jgi:tetratricopeptide (TPR) repeat protein